MNASRQSVPNNVAIVQAGWFLPSQYVEGAGSCEACVQLPSIRHCVMKSVDQLWSDDGLTVQCTSIIEKSCSGMNCGGSYLRILNMGPHIERIAQLSAQNYKKVFVEPIFNCFLMPGISFYIFPSTLKEIRYWQISIEMSSIFASFFEYNCTCYYPLTCVPRMSVSSHGERCGN